VPKSLPCLGISIPKYLALSQVKISSYSNELPLIGQHNIVNVLAALALGRQIGLNTDSMMTTIKTFKGLEHRIEWVTKKQNIDYYNDSKATNAIATITAIKALINQYLHPSVRHRLLEYSNYHGR
jgi:UDP-N-acetylmuramoylalanine--D-glutamate ligase